MWPSFVSVVNRLLPKLLTCLPLFFLNRLLFVFFPFLCVRSEICLKRTGWMLPDFCWDLLSHCFWVNVYDNWANCLWLCYLQTEILRSIPKQLPKLLLFQGGSLTSLAWYGLSIFTFCWWKENIYPLFCLSWWVLRPGVLSVWVFVYLQSCWGHLPSSASASPFLLFFSAPPMDTAHIVGSSTILGTSAPLAPVLLTLAIKEAKSTLTCWVTSLWDSNWSTSQIIMKWPTGFLGLKKKIYKLKVMKYIHKFPIERILVHNWLLLSFHWRIRFLWVKILLNVIKGDGNNESNSVYRE